MTKISAREDPVHTMRAVRYHEHGDSDVLKYETVPRPMLKDNDNVLIKVSATSVSPIDVKLRKFHVSKMAVPLPKIPGMDVSGTVVEAHPDSGFIVGDAVMAMLPILRNHWGAAAEYVAVPAKLVAKAPTNVELKNLAGIPLVGLTVLQALQDFEKDVEGRTHGLKILIQAGCGGVGTFAIQYCKNVLGMYVATTCSPTKVDFLKELGADVVIDYTTTRFEDVITDYDAVLDCMAYLYESRTLHSNVLKKGREGHYIHIPSSDPKEDPHSGLFSSSSVPEARLGSMMHFSWEKMKSRMSRHRPHYHVVFVGPDGEQLQRISQYIQEVKIRPVVDRYFTLEEMAQAHDYIEAGHAQGKVIVTVE